MKERMSRKQYFNKNYLILRALEILEEIIFSLFSTENAAFIIL